MARAAADVLDAIQAGIIVINARGAVEEINATAAQLLARSREAVRGNPVEALAGARHPLAQLARKTLHNAAAHSQNAQSIERRGAAAATVDISAAPLFESGGADEGAADGCVLLLRGRANYGPEKLEQEHAQREAFGRIAAGLAHEIKNPLGGIRGAAELLQQRAQQNAAAAAKGAGASSAELAALIVAEATRIAALMDDFMVFAKRAPLRPAALNLHQMLDEIIALLAHDPPAQGVNFVRRYDPSLPEIQADENRLRQAVLNLAKNALQAMQQNNTKTLTLRTGLAPVRIAPSPGQKTVPQLLLCVEDDGRGMDEGELRAALLPFFSTHHGGVGLGLSIAHYWVAQHRGRLQLQSARGRGTRACITLPLRQGEHNE